ncbi:uncharacterized protein BKA55DRAFT_120794 [Fusarium redolens]|uniref:Uncharacterized protein n=1 Tax=Fusarium redolens TaxID=48865 RepID=A0A9P9JY37_FUSRE|nr:uncharacterized protein BKA55DRAFT_120794 [Fusarium redolens]KAH7237476.1 hypothetical protein BKA55DRAFT_120794 [Fusarium redolens]
MLSPASGMEGREKAKKHFACEGTGSTSAWRRSLACGYAKYISTYTYLHMSAMLLLLCELVLGKLIANLSEMQTIKVARARPELITRRDFRHAQHKCARSLLAAFISPSLTSNCYKRIILRSFRSQGAASKAVHDMCSQVRDVVCSLTSPRRFMVDNCLALTLRFLSFLLFLLFLSISRLARLQKPMSMRGALLA